MKNSPERFLATVQVGVTVVGTLASVVGGVIAVEFLKPIFLAVPIGVVQHSAEFISILIVVAVISYILLVMGELVPKSLALRYSERIACFSATPLDILSRLTSVFVKALTASTRLVLKILGVKKAAEGAVVSEEEIKYYIKEGRSKGIIAETEAQLLHGIFEFADTTVKEVMVTKPMFSAIDISTPSDEVLKYIAETGYSRYPVYRESIERVEGILFNKDIFKAMESGTPVVVPELIRPPYFVPNSIMISRLLREMQRKHLHMAIVVDDQGDVDGLVTIEDILEEIVGEIEDEFDVEKNGLVERLKDGTMLIDSSASLRDLSDVGLPFTEEEEDEYNTLAGFMLAKLQRIPRGGEFVLHSGCRFTVVDMEKNRIAKVKVERVENNRPDKKAANLIPFKAKPQKPPETK
jgi:putative hemolysin